MRKLIFQEFISLDGYAADKDGTTKFFESPELNKGSDKDLLELMENIDAIILGANTYKMFVEYWPDADHEIIAEKINTTPKYVFSKSLKKAPWGKWPEATIVDEDAVTAIKEMKNQEGKNLVLWGSISLAQNLMREQLIDEYHLRVTPSAIGAGRLLFENTGELKLKLLKTKKYESGLLLAEYEA